MKKFRTNTEAERNKLLGRKHEKKLKFDALMGIWIRETISKNPKHRNKEIDNKEYFFEKKKCAKFAHIAYLQRIGITMEIDNELLKLVNEEVRESVKTLQSLANDVSNINDLLEPEIHKLVNRIRTARMTTVRELKTALTEMKDVRKFFLDKEYKTEIERLEKFVDLGERLRALIKDGTMDMITDSILKLSIGES